MRISDWSSDVCSSDLIVSAAFTGTSNNFAEVMRQNTAINAFMQARNSMSGGTGAAEIDTFAQTRADIQARNTYNSIAQQAMARSEEHTSELQSLMRISYAVVCLKKKNTTQNRV